MGWIGAIEAIGSILWGGNGGQNTDRLNEREKRTV